MTPFDISGLITQTLHSQGYFVINKESLVSKSTLFPQHYSSKNIYITIETTEKKYILQPKNMFSSFIKQRIIIFPIDYIENPLLHITYNHM